jgi:hypothetical protein
MSRTSIESRELNPVTTFSYAYICGQTLRAGLALKTTSPIRAVSVNAMQSRHLEASIKSHEPNSADANPRGSLMSKRTARVGARAPRFSLPCTEGPGSEPREVSLDGFADRWLILLFYSRDFSLL